MFFVKLRINIMSKGTSAFLKCYKWVCCYYKCYLPTNVRNIRKPNTCGLNEALLTTEIMSGSKRQLIEPQNIISAMHEKHIAISVQKVWRKKEHKNIQLTLLDTGTTFPRQIRKLAVRDGENCFKLHRYQKTACCVARKHFRMHTIGLCIQV
jgi:hypothetical protein